MTTRMSNRTQGRVTLPGVGREVENVLLWRDVRISSVAFTAGSIIYFLLEWSGYSLLTLISNLLLTALGLAFLWNNLARFTGRGGAATTAGIARPVNESDVKALAEQLTVFFNKTLACGNRLISGQDVVLTGEVAVALYVISKIGKYFSSLGLLYTVFVLAFTVPKLYEWKKDDIDSAVSQATSHSQRGYDQYLKPYVEKIPRSSASTSARPTSSSTTQPTAAGRNAGMSGDTATSQPNATFEKARNTFGNEPGYNDSTTGFGGQGSGSGRGEYKESSTIPGMTSGSGAPGFGSGTGNMGGQNMGGSSGFGSSGGNTGGQNFMDQVRNTASDMGGRVQDNTGYGPPTSRTNY